MDDFMNSDFIMDNAIVLGNGGVRVVRHAEVLLIFCK